MNDENPIRIFKLLHSAAALFHSASAPVTGENPFHAAPRARKSHNWHASRLARQRAQIDAVMNIGGGYDRVPVAAPEGYFWKQDREGSKWRLYRELAKGV